MQSVGRQIFTREMDVLEAHFLPSPQLKNLIVLLLYLIGYKTQKCALIISL